MFTNGYPDPETSVENSAVAIPPPPPSIPEGFTNGYPDAGSPEAILGIKGPSQGYQRQWYRCRTCSRVQFRDFVPYSFSTPLLSTVCGHGAAERDYGLISITVEEAVRRLVCEGASR